MANYQTEVAADSPLLWFKLTESTGGYVNSGSRGGTSAAPGTGWTRLTTGIPGAPETPNAAATSTGVATSVADMTTSSDFMTAGAFTFECWFKASANPSVTRWMVFYGPTNTAGLNMTTAGLVQFALVGGTSSATAASTTSYADGVWHHAVGVYESTHATEKSRLYVDGVKVGTANVTVGTFTTGTKFAIGRATTASWVGDLDEVAAYGAVLSDTRIAAHTSAGLIGSTHSATILGDAPSLYYRLEETTGSPINSGSETTNTSTGIVGAGVTRNVTGRVGQGWSFAGNNTSNVTISDAAAKYSDSIFTLECWAKTNQAARAFISVGDSVVDTSYITLGINTSGFAEAIVRGTSTQVLTGAVDLRSTTVWHHLVLVVNGATKTLYVDGVLITTNSTAVGAISATVFYIGQANNNAINGTLDEIAVFDKALSTPRINAHYVSGSPVPVPGGYTAQPMTATSLMVDPVVTTQKTISASGQAMPATTLMVDPVVSTVRNLSYTATPMTASTTAPGGVASIAVSYASIAMTATATIVAPTVTIAKNYPATPATAAVTMPDPVITTTKTVSASGQPMTASASMPNGVPMTKDRALTTTWAGISSATPSTVDYNTATSYFLGGGASGGTLINVNLSSLPSDAILGKSILRVYRNSGVGTLPLFLSSIDTSYTQSSVTYNTAPAPGAITISASSTTTGYIDIDVSTIVNAIKAGTAYGIRIDGGSTGAFYLSNLSLTNPASLSVNYFSNAVDVTASSSAMTASATSVTPTVSLAVNASYTAQAMTATATIVEPSISTVSDAVFSALPLTAAATMPGGSYTNVAGISVTAGVMSASATIVDATTTTERNPNFFASPLVATAIMDNAYLSFNAEVTANPMEAGSMMGGIELTGTGNVFYHAQRATASARLAQPYRINGAPIIVNELEDKYYLRVLNQSPRYWFKASAKVDNTFVNRMNAINNLEGSLTDFGATVEEFGGPNDGDAIVFDGVNDYLHQVEASDDEITIDNSTFEFTFKTTKSNQFLFGGSDRSILRNISSTWWLSDGKLQQRDGRGGVTFTAFTNLANDQWHHVAIVSVDPLNGLPQNKVEVYVDGKLEIRRYLGRGGDTEIVRMGFPDYVGGAPGPFIQAPEGPFVPFSPTSMFEGKMADMVFHLQALPQTEIQRNYYAMMGFNPVYVDPMTAGAESVTPSVRNGRPRMLYLYWSPAATNMIYRVDENGLVFDAFPGVLNGGTALWEQASSPTHAVELAGFDVFSFSVMGPSAGRTYRDEVTDEYRMIDLEKDINLSDFDCISFRDWPPFGPSAGQNAGGIDFVNFYGGQSRYEVMRDKLLSQLIDAVNSDTYLLVSNPNLAVDLGIVDRVEFCPDLKESKFHPYQGQGAQGGYDYGAAVQFPFNVSNGGGQQPVAITSPDWLDYKALFYADTHKNNAYRVRALIDGLTSLPSVMMTEVVWHQGSDLFGDKLAAARYIDRQNGLQIGDEFVFWGTDRYGNTRSDSYSEPGNPWGSVNLAYARFGGAWAAPLDNVKAGTVVTTFSDKVWQGKSIVNNPYRNYATTIVIRPGDVLEGRTITGKIFVNFTESPSVAEREVPFQIVPPNEQLTPRGFESETQRAWQYSFTRVTTVNTNLASGGETMNIVDSQGNVKGTIAGDNNSEGTLYSTRYNELYPVEYHGLKEMFYRGLLWLSVKPEIADGDMIVNATAMTANGVMNTNTATGQKNLVLNAQPMIANAEIVKPSSVSDPNVNRLVLPMYAQAQMGSSGRSIIAEPMTAAATIVDNLQMVAGSGEEVVVYLHSKDITLYLKEDTA
jgi:hypothetical protein